MIWSGWNSRRSANAPWIWLALPLINYNDLQWYSNSFQKIRKIVVGSRDQGAFLSRFQCMKQEICQIPPDNPRQRVGHLHKGILSHETLVANFMSIPPRFHVEPFLSYADMTHHDFKQHFHNQKGLPQKKYVVQVPCAISNRPRNCKPWPGDDGVEQ